VCKTNLTKKIFLYLFFIAIFLTNSISYALDFSGTIDTDTTWTILDSPINLQGTTAISSGATLTIDRELS